MSVIEEIKQRIDIVEVIGQYTSLTKSGRTFRGLCPFHSEKHPSFFVYPEQQSWHCFGACSTGGDVFSFVMKKEGIDFGEALRLMADKAGVSLPSRFEPGAQKDDRERLCQINETAAQHFHNLLLNSQAGEKARNYLDNRGLLTSTVTSFQLGFSLNSWEALKQHLMDIGYTQDELLTAGLIIAGESGKIHDRFRNRLMFPICNSSGRVVGFGARALDDSMPKYLNSPQTPVFDKSSILYGMNLAAPAIRQQDRAVITEGYMDVITAHQNGFDNVIASMGTSITEPQVNILKRFTRNIVLALDADAAGEEAMLRGIGFENTLNAEVKVITLPEGKDPDDVIREDSKTWQDLLEKALPIVDYTFNMVTSSLDLATARDKSLAADSLLPIIAEIKDPVRQAHYLQKLARLVKVTERNLEAELGRIKLSRSNQRVKAPKREVITHTRSTFLSRPVEEHCLALLLRYPEFKDHPQQLLPEYFENSENREIFATWQQVSDLALLKEKLDPAIREHLTHLLELPKEKGIPNDQIEPRYSSYLLRLREEYLRSLEKRRGAALASEAEQGGSAAALAKLKEQGIEISTQLGEVFAQKRGKTQEVSHETRKC